MKAVPTSQQSKFMKPYQLKNTIIPDGFILLQDTREQAPLFARIPKGLTICSATLTDGDYSVQGMSNLICFERKAHDIFSYATTEYDKTKKKMERFKKFEFVGLIIELKESELFQFQQFTKVHPESIRGALISWEIRYNVHIFYGNREHCARWLLDRATKFYTMKKEI